jgi:hypothetical protein
MRVTTFYEMSRLFDECVRKGDKLVFPKDSLSISNPSMSERTIYGIVPKDANLFGREGDDASQHQVAILRLFEGNVVAEGEGLAEEVLHENRDGDLRDRGGMRGHATELCKSLLLGTSLHSIVAAKLVVPRDVFDGVEVHTGESDDFLEKVKSFSSGQASIGATDLLAEVERLKAICKCV